MVGHSSTSNYLCVFMVNVERCSITIIQTRDYTIRIGSCWTLHRTRHLEVGLHLSTQSSFNFLTIEQPSSCGRQSFLNEQDIGPFCLPTPITQVCIFSRRFYTALSVAVKTDNANVTSACQSCMLVIRTVTVKIP